MDRPNQPDDDFERERRAARAVAESQTPEERAAARAKFAAAMTRAAFSWARGRRC